jgi:UDP:flavonoid glycosyltransferase YjiC (YdhE family)
MSISIGYVISGHGFGHATRAIAVMQALQQCMDVRFIILTSVPPWLFHDSLTAPHVVHAMETDIGLVQHSALSEDLPATLKALRGLYPLRKQHIDKAAVLLSGCHLVFSDIAPLGIVAAKRADIPSILVENFTWDWIYAPFEQSTPGLAPLSHSIGELFLQADFHIQAKPICNPGPCDLVVEPVARQLRTPEQVRLQMQCRPNQRLVLVTMGGIKGQLKNMMNLDALKDRDDTVFVLTGMSNKGESQENLRLLAPDTSCYFPDLVASADLVVGKSGYSTVAEAYQGQTAYGYIKRPGFRESQVLESFLDSYLTSWEIKEHALESGAWLNGLDQFDQPQKPTSQPENGAAQIALFVHSLL